MNAINEMTYDFNWTENGDVGISFAVEQSETMLEGLKVLNFNPFPVGMIFPYGGLTAPDGYLMCDGGSYVEDDYPELFAAIGETYGGDGTNFNVPDARNNVVVGGGDIYSVGETGGETEVFLDVAALPSHNHVADAPSVTDLGHTHAESAALPTAITIGAGVPAPSALPSVSVTGLGFTGISVAAPNINNTGGDGAHNNLQPFIAINYVIYAGR